MEPHSIRVGKTYRARSGEFRRVTAVDRGTVAARSPARSFSSATLSQDDAVTGVRGEHEGYRTGNHAP